MKNIFALLLFLSFFSFCNNKKQEIIAKNIQHTCPMHLQVLKDGPGECPICHMDLVPVQQIGADTTSDHNDNGKHLMTENMTTLNNGDSTEYISGMSSVNELTLSDQQIKMGNIQVDTIGQYNFNGTNIMPGTVVLNEKNVETISARISGRIERLYYKNTGDYIVKGAKIYDLYSEELNSAKQEYILLQKQKTDNVNSIINYDQVTSAARQKLLLWGMTKGQVNALKANTKPSHLTAFYAKAGGYINQLNISEGAFINTGQQLMSLANTSSVWVEVQGYASQFSSTSNLKKVKVIFPYLANKTLQGTIEFVSPEINTKSRLNLMRINVINPANQLKPGMVAYVYLNKGLISNTVLPVAAIIKTTGPSYIWIKAGNNTFKMKTVVTGAESSSMVEIKQGLHPNDVVVVEGTYLLNSEYLLRNGLNSMADMGM